MNTIEKKVPSLRFPEFTEEWEEKKLGEVLSIGNGRDYKHLNKGSVPVYGTGGYMTSVDNFLHDGETVCIGRKGTIDSPMYHKGKIWTVDTLFYTHSFIDSKPKFIYYIFQNIRWKYYNEASGVPSLSKKTIDKIKDIFPALPEQEKIVNFLSAVDSKLQALKDKKERLEAYKRGAMQQIFSQEIRFTHPDGSQYPDWEEKKMGEVLDLVIRSVPKPKEAYWRLGIRSHAKGTFTECVKNPDQINMDTLYEVKENDIILNITFAWEHAIALVKKEDVGKLVSHRFPTYEIKINYYSVFLKYLIFRKEFKNQLDLISPGGAGRNRVLNKNEFLKLKINLPSLDEQKQIADFLSAIDHKIILVSEQINNTEQYKKGLLQQMFV